MSKRIRNNYRICFGGVGDDYVLGVLAGKLNAVSFIRSQLAISDKTSMKGGYLKQERNTLFSMGVADDPSSEWKDLSHELRRVRHSNPRQFDKLVIASVGQAALASIMDAIAHVRQIDRENRRTFCRLIEMITACQEA